MARERGVDWCKAFAQEPQQEKFLHMVVDKICGRPGPLEAWSAPFGDMKKEQVGFQCEKVLRDTRAHISKKDSTKAASFTIAEFKTVLESVTSSQADFAEILDTFVTVLDQRRDELFPEEIQDGTADLSIARLSAHSLRDFDWTLRVIAASDTVADCNIPLLALDLHIADSNGMVRTETIELDSAELDSLISTCNDIGRAIEQVSC